MKFTFLSEKFYNDYPHNIYQQLEVKENRPYAHIYVELYGVVFAIPLRSNIQHPHAFFTNKNKKCGVDFSKSVVIENKEYINNEQTAFLRTDEFNKLKGKDYRIKNMLLKYIELYKRAKTDEKLEHRDEILKYSSLQYFEKYIYNTAS